MKEFRRFSEKSDVYSFGVFLLELLSGREASDAASLDSNKNLVEMVSSHWSISLQAMCVLLTVQFNLYCCFVYEGAR